MIKKFASLGTALSRDEAKKVMGGKRLPPQCQCADGSKPSKTGTSYYYYQSNNVMETCNFGGTAIGNGVCAIGTPIYTCADGSPASIPSDCGGQGLTES